jgi:hypothetical protein
MQSRKVTGSPGFRNGKTQTSTSISLLLAALLLKPFRGVAQLCLNLSKKGQKRRILMVCRMKTGPQFSTLA